MNHHVYIIYSEELDKHYVGMTSDLVSRLQKHLTNHSGYTGFAKDWNVVYSKECENKSEAILLERKIKKRGASRFLDDIKTKTS